jgi:outer membrane biosynthesis protein TonB
MKEEPNPPRLIQDPALRPLLLPEVERAISPERLAKSKAAIAKTVASGAGATAIIGIKGIAALVVIGSAGAWYLLDRDEPAPQVEPIEAEPIEAEPIEAEPIEAQPTIQEPAIEPPPIEAPPPKRAKKQRSVRQDPPAPAEAPSALEQQLARLRAAREASDRGAKEEALALLTDFPDGAISLDAALLRIEVLISLDRKVEAIDAIDRSLSRLSGAKKAELLRLQGDLRFATGDHLRACEAYRRSLALDPEGANAEASRRGLDRCLDR